MAIAKYTVSRDDNIYEAWPDLMLTEGGKLICIFTETQHHRNRENSRLMICESADRGRTWSKKKPFTEKGTAECYFNNARISRLNDGRLAVICDKITHDENRKSEIYVWLGNAEGEVWGEPTVYPFCGIVPDKLLQLESGRLIICAHFKNRATSKLEQYLWYSDDGGKTWSDRITVAASPDYNLCEASILDCKNGMLVAFLRENSYHGHDMLKVISYDGGETWGPILHTPIDCGHRPTSGFLADGTVMVTYRFIPGGTQNVFAAFLNRDQLESDERCRQTRVRILPLDYDRNPAPDLGYTGWVQFPDSEIYVVNYIKDDADKAYIRGYSFYPTDVMLPKTFDPTDNVF